MKSIPLFHSIAAAILLATTSTHAGDDRPNIIFILTDDQGYGDLGRHGHPLLNTPNMDRLHDDSVRFDNFYVSPSCSPTRAALMTGMHEFKNGVTHTLQPREHLFKEAITLPQLLKTVGYTTAFIGKWHLGGSPGYAPNERGFDWTSTNPQGPRKHFDVEMIRNGKRSQTKGYREDRFFDEAMAFIEQSGDQPFFCYLATYSPHTPLGAPEELIARYRGKVSEKHATYLAMVENIDQNLGRLTDFLKERNLEKDTIMLFMNDNGQTEGLDVYNAGMRGCKATVWEGGTRAMSFWKWTGRWQPRTVNNLTAHLDVVPTLCELAGVKIPQKLQTELEGFSLLPLLTPKKQGKWEHDDRHLFHNVGRWPSGTAASHKHVMSGVRKGNFLLVRSVPCDDPECAKFQSQCTTLRAVRKGLKTTTYTQGNAQYHWGVSAADRWSLFDVKKDPGCQSDVALEHPEFVSGMIAAYDQWWDDTYPVMIERGGDQGDPEESAHAASRARQHAATVNSKKKAAGTVKKDTGKKDTGKKSKAFARMDTDGDGKVTKKEYTGNFVRVFTKKDLDRDGVLTAKEFANAAVFKGGDLDKDGKLTPDEFKNFYSRQFDARDANKDGVLTSDEM